MGPLNESRGHAGRPGTAQTPRRAPFSYCNYHKICYSLHAYYGTIHFFFGADGVLAQLVLFGLFYKLFPPPTVPWSPLEVAARTQALCRAQGKDGPEWNREWWGQNLCSAETGNWLSIVIIVVRHSNALEPQPEKVLHLLRAHLTLEGAVTGERELLPA